MKQLSRVWRALTLVAFIVPLVGSSGAALAEGRPPTRTGGVRPHHHRINWVEHDRAVYAVSTLNAPLCSNGQQLSTVLWRQDNARLFYVFHSLPEPNLYYIVARSDEHHVVGVYAYNFGWKVPEGVKSARCVATASPQVMADFRREALIFVARFHTTFPQS